MAQDEARIIRESMSEASEWHRGIEANVESLRTRLGASDAREYQMDKLLKIARRVDEFSAACAQCHSFKPEIQGLVAELAATPAILKSQKRSYLGRLGRMVDHLHKTHHLISEGQNLAIWLSIGTALGMALGGAFQNTFVGIPVGAGVGTAIGAALDGRARRDGRVI